MNDLFDVDAARERYRQEPDETLIRIAFTPGSTFRPEAIRLAREELASRGIHRDDHDAVVETQASIAAESAAAAARAQTPLATGYKVLCFVLADLVAIVVVLVHFAVGRHRAATEGLKWMGYGWLARFALVGLLAVVWR